jgi:hypothetical protein
MIDIIIMHIESDMIEKMRRQGSLGQANMYTSIQQANKFD